MWSLGDIVRYFHLGVAFYEQSGGAMNVGMGWVRHSLAIVGMSVGANGMEVIAGVWLQAG